MPAARVPVLWICGPPGAGKTTAGWAVYSALAADGVAVAYPDIDQFGMCYPEPAADPGRHRRKTVNLDAVIAGYAAAGTRCVVVSGVTDPSAVPMRARRRRPRSPCAIRRLQAGNGRVGWPVATDRSQAPVRPDLPAPDLPAPDLAALPPAPVGGEVLLICGATATGKSAAGFDVYQREQRAGRSAAC